MTTLRHRLVGLLATLAVLAITAGLPVLLLAIGANPIPATIPSLDTLTESLLVPDDGSLVLAVLEVVAWAAWGFMTLSLLVELSARLRGVRAPRLPGLVLPQAAARGLIATSALLFITAPLVTGASTATAAPDTHPHAPTTQAAASASSAGARADHAQAATARLRHSVEIGHASASRPHTVKPGESLWSIAARDLGDGSRFNEIADLNRDVVGDEPGFLSPGWVLQIPTANTGTAATSYTVKSGDTLGTIARDTLGDSERYMDIFRASAGLTQADGATLTDPNLIQPGWTLTIPTQTPQGPVSNPAQSHDPDQRQADQRQADNEPTDTADQNEKIPREERGAGKERTGTAVKPEGQQPAATPAPERARENTDKDASANAGPDASSRDDVAKADDAGGADDAGEAGGADDSVLSARWMLAGLTGGGVLLSGALFLATQARRRSQFRARRPGRMIATPAPELAPVEKSITATGMPAAATVEFTDTALRRLAASVGAAESAMPPLAAVELGHDALTLHLSAPADLPAPWIGTPDRTHWHVSTGVDIDDLGPDVGYTEPPYPLLLTIGASDTGETWMLNCEELASLTITGDPRVARDLARHLAAQLAVNPWSTSVNVDCVGVGEEAAAMDERLTYHPTGHSSDGVIEDLLASAVATIDGASAYATDVSTARTGYVNDDVWPARILLMDAAAGDPPGLEQLLRLIDEHAGRAATSVVIAGERPGHAGVSLHVTTGGRIILEHAGLDLLAVGLTSDEARGCALLYAQRDNLEDTAIPIDEAETDGWEAYADRTGGLRIEHTLARDIPDDAIEEPVTSLLEDNDEDYLVAGAAIAEDLQMVAPKVPASVRAAVEAADPQLDQDLADWFAVECPRPRLTLLGPVNARTHGKALAKRKAYFTEVLAYLALRRRHGATRDEICEAFGVSPGKARDYINIVRDWLGTNPATGWPHLPHADKSPAAMERGVSIYQVDDGLLIDAELFQRLNLRAKARGGTRGHHDLVTALQLVTGRPFDQLRPGGWSWLHEGERHDEYALVAIADVAFTLITHCLTDGDLARARAAAEIAMLAAPDEEVTRLCMVRINEAEGDNAEAQRILRDEVCNRTDTEDAPTELSERTDSIIRNHQWLAS